MWQEMTDDRFIPIKEASHLIQAEPDRFPIQRHFQLRLGIAGSGDSYLLFGHDNASPSPWASAYVQDPG